MRVASTRRAPDRHARRGARTDARTAQRRHPGVGRARILPPRGATAMTPREEATNLARQWLAAGPLFLDSEIHGITNAAVPPLAHLKTNNKVNISHCSCDKLTRHNQSTTSSLCNVTTSSKSGHKRQTRERGDLVMRQTSIRSKAAFLARLILPVLMFGMAVTVEAVPAYEVESIYYSDATRTEDVGGYILGCDDSHSAWGRVSEYTSTSRTSCGGPSGPGPGPLPCEFTEKGCSHIPDRNDGHFPNRP
jgi:hypothetical protein